MEASAAARNREIAAAQTGTVPAAAHAPLDGLLARYHDHSAVVSLLMAGHHLRVLNARYRQFGGDLLLSLLALEVWRYAAATGEEPLERRYPVARLPTAVGLPRETTRRRLHRLVEAGWLRSANRREVAPTATLAAAFHPAQDGWVVEDFRRTAARLRTVLAPDACAAERARLRRELAEATRTAPPPAPAFACQMPKWPAPGPQPAAAPADPIGNGSARPQPALAPGRELADYHLRHLQRLRTAFGGDLLLPLLLGELSHYCVSPLLRDPGVDLPTLDALLGPDPDRALLASFVRPCNAYSLANGTGVPDSTVRRRIAELVARGWVQVADGGDLRHAPGIVADFAALNLATARDFLATDGRVRAMLAGD